MMDPCLDQPMEKCPACGHKKIGGPQYRRGNWGYRYYGWLVYFCRRCGFEQKVPTDEDRGRDAERASNGAANNEPK